MSGLHAAGGGESCVERELAPLACLVQCTAGRFSPLPSCDARPDIGTPRRSFHGLTFHWSAHTHLALTLGDSGFGMRTFALLVLLAACHSVVSFPVLTSSNGSVLIRSAFDGQLRLSAGSGRIVASSLFAADNGIGLNATLLNEAYLSNVSNTLAAHAAVDANIANTLAAVLDGLSSLQASFRSLAARVDAMGANVGLLDSLVVSPPMPRQKFWKRKMYMLKSLGRPAYPPS